MRRGPFIAGVTVLLAMMVITNTSVRGQLQDTFFDGVGRPEIAYTTRPLTDRVSDLNRRIQNGGVSLAFEPGHGYLRSLLKVLNIPIESQLAVYSKTSVQSPLISPRNPRTIFFNDSVVVGWPRGGFIEIAAQDPVQGVIFYALEEREVAKPQLTRTVTCLVCHNSYATLNVPGMLVRSIVTAADGKTVPRLGNYASDHRSPFSERWGGWYVTGDVGSMAHMGNTTVADEANITELVPSRPMPALLSLAGTFDTDGYLAPYSDIVALMVFEHQMYMTNLLTRIAWEIRVAAAERRPDVADLVRTSAKELVDYMLFVDEAPLSSPVRSTSGFAERFAAGGPADDRGRSLRQFDLQKRLMRYPCSYMIYSEAFDKLPLRAKTAIYARMWEILSGGEKTVRYSRLSPADRQAILEILRQTKADLPDSFRRP
jgi:hypothetical protein